MIQRIQSIFLLIAAIASFALLGTPFASAKKTIASPIFADSVYNLNDHIALLLIFVVAGALALSSIFLFKNRATQMRIASISMVANLIGVGFALFLLFQNKVDFNSLALSVGAFLPVIAIVFELLANRFIRKDEKLVRSMDRLR